MPCDFVSCMHFFIWSSVLYKFDQSMKICNEVPVKLYQLQREMTVCSKHL